MSHPGRPSRRSLLKAGMGLTLAGTGALGAGLYGATPAAAAQNGTPLCDESGDSAAAVGLGSGDLGIPYYRPHDSTWGYVFGDSWAGMQQADGTYLGSPVMLDQAGFDASGATPISFTWAEPNGTAAQLFDYAHNADNGYGTEVSRIPNDCIEFGGRTYI